MLIRAYISNIGLEHLSDTLTHIYQELEPNRILGVCVSDLLMSKAIIWELNSLYTPYSHDSEVWDSQVKLREQPSRDVSHTDQILNVLSNQ